MKDQEIVLPVYLSSGTIDFVNIYRSTDDRLVVICKITNSGRGTHAPTKCTLRETVEVPTNDLPVDYYILIPSTTTIPEAERSYEAVVFDPRSHNIISDNEIPDNVADCLFIAPKYSEERKQGYYTPASKVKTASPPSADSTLGSTYLGFFAAGVGAGVGAYCASELFSLLRR